MSRERVPVTLRSELSEYLSLLRALRTSNTLDLSEQLVKQHQEVVSEWNPSASIDTANETGIRTNVDVEADYSQPDEGFCLIGGNNQNQETSSPISAEAKGKGRATNNLKTKFSCSSIKSNERELWTRWPLLAGDVYAPEFPFEDEVEYIACAAVDAFNRFEAEHQNIDMAKGEESYSEHAVSGVDAELSSDDLDLPLLNETLSPLYLQALAASTKYYLSKTLSLLAKHVPIVEKSLRDRLRPMNWESILSIAAVSGDIEPDIIRRVKDRLEAIYGFSESQAYHRATIVRESKRILEELYEKHTLALFKFNGPPSLINEDSKKTRKRRRKKREDVI